MKLSPNQGAAENGLSAGRSSVAGNRERTVRSTAAAEAVAELGSRHSETNDMKRTATLIRVCIAVFAVLLLVGYGVYHFVLSPFVLSPSASSYL